MNNVRRKRIDEIHEMLKSTVNEFYRIKSCIQDILEEEEEYRNNIPENMQDSERYDKADAACDSLNNAADSMDELIATLDSDILSEILGYLENAKE